MARRRGRIRTRTRTIYKRARSSRAGGFAGKFKPAIAGAMCSAGGNLASGFLGEWGHPVACGAVGYLMHDKTAMFMAGYAAGGMLMGNGGFSIGGGVR